MTASVRLAPNSVIVDATDMRLCGIAIPFTATLTPGSVAVSARGTARNQALADTVPCLWGDNFAATGTYDLDVELSASAPPAELLARGARQLSRCGALRADPPLDRIEPRSRRGRSGGAHARYPCGHAGTRPRVPGDHRCRYARGQPRAPGSRDAGQSVARYYRERRGRRRRRKSRAARVGGAARRRPPGHAPRSGLGPGTRARPSSSFRSASPAASPIPK